MRDIGFDLGRYRWVWLLAMATVASLVRGDPCAGSGGSSARVGLQRPVLDGFVDTSYVLLTEAPFAAPLAGGLTNASDSAGEAASSTIYDTLLDSTVPDFTAVNLAGEGHTADIRKFHVTWDADYLFLAVEGPTAFHRGFGMPDRADLFIAIDTRDSRCTDTTPTQKQGGDIFSKKIDFAGWQPSHFVGLEYCQLGGSAGYVHLTRAFTDAAGTITSKFIVATDVVPNTQGTNTFEFNARRDTAVTEFRIPWGQLGGRPDACTGAAWNFAVYTTGNENGYDAFDTAPGVGQSVSNGFEAVGDCPFDADYCGTRRDPVTGLAETSCGWGESDNQSGPGIPNAPKIPSSDNSGAWNNNEVDTIQEYFRVTNIGQIPGTPPQISCPDAVTTNVPCGATGALVHFDVPAVVTGSCPVASVTTFPPSGSLFPVGTNLVRAVATDVAGASNVCAFSIVVRRNDSVPPAFAGVPPATSVECGQHVSLLNDPGDVTAFDACEGAVGVNYYASLDPQLPECPPYTIVRTWVATDGSGNAASTQQVVTVVDTTPPAVTCPGDIAMYVPGTASMIRVSYAAQASDACTTVSLSYAPTSGSWFAVGVVSTVSVTAVDACGNTTSCSFMFRPTRLPGSPVSGCRTAPVALDGFVNPGEEGWSLVTERDFASPAAGTIANHSDMIGEASARLVYDCNSDPNITNFTSINIETSEYQDADIEDLYITWDTNYLYLAVVGPNAFHRGFGIPDRADLFIAIDTNRDPSTLTSPVSKKGGDWFDKSVDFAGWSPDYFVGIEWITNGGAHGYAHLVRPQLSGSGTVTHVTMIGTDIAPGAIGSGTFEFNGRRDSSATECRIPWSALGGRPASGASWRFAVYTTGDGNGYDLYDVAPGTGQGESSGPFQFEVIGDTPFDADHCDGAFDPVTKVADSSCGYGESDRNAGWGLANGFKVPSSDNSAPFNNNEYDTIQGYFVVNNVGAIVSTSSCPFEATGLRGEYYYVTQELVGPSVARLDANVDFNWVYGTPMPVVPVDTFSIRWTGRVEPEFSETYTFHLETDNGCRLWVNGKLIVEKWDTMTNVVADGSITLVAGQPADIVLEYQEVYDRAWARLYWSSPSRPRQIIPRDRFWAVGVPVNHQPITPIVNEPPLGYLVNAQDLHMQTEPMYNPIDSDEHRESEYVIYDASTNEIVWAAYGVSNGPVKTHLHYGDGVFMNSFSNELALAPSSNYVLQVRFRDSSGDPATEWSPWATRHFATGAGGGGSLTNLWEVKHGFEVEMHSEGFQLPVSIVFPPAPGTNDTDLFYYVGELYGNIRAVLRDGTVLDYATNILNFDPLGVFPGAGETGMGSICLDNESGDFFATMLYSANPSDPAAPRYPKVTRVFSSPDGMTATGMVDIVTFPGESQPASHQISHVSIGPDDKLYLHVGDGFVVSNATSLFTVQGKILRMEKNGSPCTDNPFYNAANGIAAADYIWAYGLRNPFGGGWRAKDRQHYSVENGPTVDRFARITAGMNLGYNGLNASMTNHAVFLWSPATAPVGLAFIETNTFNGSDFPAEYYDNAFVAETGPTWATGPQTNNLVSNGKRIRMLAFNAAGNVVSNEPIVTYVGAGKATCAAVAAGPDGLYFSDLYKVRDFQSPIDPGSRIWVIKNDHHHD